MQPPTWYSFPAEHICSHLSIARQLFSRSKSGVIFRPLIIGIAFICSWNIGYAWADSLESAFMPGQVIQGHAKWEEDCGKCHKRFDKAAQTRLCQDCHKDIREDINRKQRIHGRLTEQHECKDCHTDHKGRGENIAPINESTFNHSHTNFALSGAHADSKKADCKACHKLKIKYRDTPSDCLACHKKDDYHKGVFDPKCGTCHSEKDWKTSPFNHDKGTKYPLLGKHRTTKCESCHKVPVAKEKTPTTCYACHKKDDKHEGALGRACESCHKEKDWKDTPSFDHDKIKFPLRGKHIDTKCKNCHPDQRYKPTPVDCYSCHQKDDYHKGVFGQKCETCHSETDWKTTPFNHDEDTKYPLQGKHKTTKCENCHKVSVAKEKTPATCNACHKKDDKHEEALGRACEQCHTEKEWKDTHLFDHNKTTFPLLGKHDKVACKGCHVDQRYKPTPLDCYSCHKKDDNHKGDYGEKCRACHADRTWKEITFDHDRDTKYSLKGKHKTTKCETCHTGHLYKEKTPTDCYACHKKDDKHKGQQGKQCEDCHRESSWKAVTFDHNKTRFSLRGQHDIIDCKKCHRTLLFKDVPLDCISCHEKEDIHKKRLGTQCETCHTARDWKLWDFDHDLRTKFLLDGAHKTLDCYDCHKKPMEGKVLAPTVCIGCHRKDDKHDGGLGPQCDRCHYTSLWKTIKSSSMIRR